MGVDLCCSRYVAHERCLVGDVLMPRHRTARGGGGGLEVIVMCDSDTHSAHHVELRLGGCLRTVHEPRDHLTLALLDLCAHVRRLHAAAGGARQVSAPPVCVRCLATRC
jgi:hypothetical protein